MKINKQSRYTHFYVEMIFVLLFFSMVMAVIMYIFSVTNKKNSLAQYKSKATNCSELFINSYKTDYDIERAVKLAFGEGEIENDDEKITISLDSDFNISEKENIKVFIIINKCEEYQYSNTLLENIEMIFVQNIFEDEQEIYKINAGSLKEIRN